MRGLPLLALALAPLCAALAAQPATLRSSDALSIDGVVEITLAQLRDFKWRPGKQPPKRIRALDGQRVRISGFMALDTPEGVEEFQLFNDSCGCDGNIKPHHFVLVQLDDDTTRFTPDELTVTGTFAVGEIEEDGFVTSLYRLEAETLE